MNPRRILKTLRLAQDPPPDYLLQSTFTARAEVEFTTRCNLRCVYCHSLQPQHHGTDLSSEHLDSIIDTLVARNVLAVGVSGSGETTIVKNWDSYCRRLLDRGLDLFITTNLAKELTDAEAATLAGFLIIQVSCDTVDRPLFRSLRRGAVLDTLLYNMGKIRSQAYRQGIRGPFFWWNIVVSDMTIRNLEEYVTFGLGQGVKHFNFLNMYTFPPVRDVQTPSPITDLPLEKLALIPAIFEKAFALIKRGGASYTCDSLLDEVAFKLGAPQVKQSWRRKLFAVEPGEGRMTKDCLDPWIYVKVSSNAGVLPCCASEEIASLNDGESLQEIINGSKMVEYREGILTGRLKSYCRSCKIRGWTDLETINLKVRLLARANHLPVLLHRWGLLVPLLHKWRA
jgi:MoaA/NifB/PqqE/SkfB family radical SAM enzyme